MIGTLKGALLIGEKWISLLLEYRHHKALIASKCSYCFISHISGIIFLNVEEISMRCKSPNLLVACPVCAICCILYDITWCFFGNIRWQLINYWPSMLCIEFHSNLKAWYHRGIIPFNPVREGVALQPRSYEVFYPYYSHMSTESLYITMTPPHLRTFYILPWQFMKLWTHKAL